MVFGDLVDGKLVVDSSVDDKIVDSTVVFLQRRIWG